MGILFLSTFLAATTFKSMILAVALTQSSAECYKVVLQ
jgi:hypothetical protein